MWLWPWWRRCNCCRNLLRLTGDRRLNGRRYRVTVIVDILDLLRRLGGSGLCFRLVDRLLLITLASCCEQDCGEKADRGKLSPESLSHRCFSSRTSFVENRQRSRCE